MNIVEYDPSKNTEYAYGLVCDDYEEFAQFQRGISSSALEWIAENVTTPIPSLYDEIDDGLITSGNRQYFEEILDPAMVQARIDRVMRRGAEGYRSGDDVMREVNDLESISDEADCIVQHTGIRGELHTGRLRDWLSDEPLKPFSKKLAEQVGATVTSAQYELVHVDGRPEFLSDRGHTSHGVLEDSGRFHPLVTELSVHHPVRKLMLASAAGRLVTKA